MKEKLIEILVKHQFDGKDIIGPKWGTIASEIEELYKDYYDKSFIEWLSSEGFEFDSGNCKWLFEDIFNQIIKWETINELYEHWKTIKDKQ